VLVNPAVTTKPIVVVAVAVAVAVAPVEEVLVELELGSDSIIIAAVTVSS